MRYQVIIILCSFFVGYLKGQNRSALEQKRLDIIQQIEETDRQLSNTKKKEVATFSDYQLIVSQIKNREKLLSTIQNELVFVEEDIGQVRVKQTRIHAQLTSVSKKYKSILNTMYKQMRGQSKWIYILDSKSINDSFRRWQYLKQYESNISHYAERLKNIDHTLNLNMAALEDRMDEKQKLIETERSQFEALQVSMKHKQEMLKQLKDRSDELKVELAGKRVARERLNGAIENIIFKTLTSSTDENQETLNTETSAISSKATEAKVGGTFESYKGKLPWPIKGTIVSEFGKRKHQDLKGVYVENNGIDIQAYGRNEVHCVFEGRVVGNSKVAGFGSVVIVQHDDFYTVYSKLNEVFVEFNEVLTAGQLIGKISLEDQRGILHFEVWKEKKKINPKYWLQL